MGLTPEFITGDDLNKQITEFTGAVKPLVAGMVTNS